MKEEIIDTGIFKKARKIAESDEERHLLSLPNIFEYFCCEDDLKNIVRELQQKMKDWHVSPDENGYVTKWNPEWPMAADLADCWNKLQDVQKLIKRRDSTPPFELLMRGIDIGKLLKQIEVRKFERDVIKRKNQLKPLEEYNEYRDKTAQEKKEIVIQLLKKARAKDSRLEKKYIIPNIIDMTSYSRTFVYNALKDY